jgi:hypothetical protein
MQCGIRERGQRRRSGNEMEDLDGCAGVRCILVRIHG